MASSTAFGSRARSADYSTVSGRLASRLIVNSLLPPQVLNPSEVSSGALQQKFLDDGAGTLEYSGLSSFFGGLEAKIGAPDPKVYAAMEREHRAAGDSQRKFVTANYGVRFP